MQLRAPKPSSLSCNFKPPSVSGVHSAAAGGPSEQESQTANSDTADLESCPTLASTQTVAHLSAVRQSGVHTST